MLCQTQEEFAQERAAWDAERRTLQAYADGVTSARTALMGKVAEMQDRLETCSADLDNYEKMIAGYRNNGEAPQSGLVHVDAGARQDKEMAGGSRKEDVTRGKSAGKLEQDVRNDDDAEILRVDKERENEREKEREKIREAYRDQERVLHRSRYRREYEVLGMLDLSFVHENDMERQRASEHEMMRMRIWELEVEVESECSMCI
jgi:hypothetical protein